MQQYNDNTLFQHVQTPLHLAAENDHSDVVKLFLKHRPELVTMANTVCIINFELATIYSKITNIEMYKS